MNHLKNALSPYLLQHVENPVDWYMWGDEPFAKARKEDKPVLVSIGYAACHWCHVMAEESFENKTVAAYMNEHFVCIKVDREEHPDVDNFFMDAVQSLSGNGGWPLNVFVTPDREPFYGGTYFPPEKMYGRSSWMDVLKAVVQAWRSKRNDIRYQSGQMMAQLQKVSESVAIHEEATEINPQIAEFICQNMLNSADRKDGGFGTAPKFPASFSIKYLLDFYYYQKRKDAVDDIGQQALQHAELTLDKMLHGGIFDQVGGGFFRYATDKEWVLPHYEKMLGDNALMISLLCVAYRVTRKPLYKRALRETVEFCNREMKGGDSPGFFCSLDADSDGKEGGFYTWNQQQWQAALSTAHPAIAAYYGMSGEFHDTLEQHPLVVAKTDEEIKVLFELTEEDWQDIRDDARERLLTERMTRACPAVDDKILLSWNALMNIALQESAIVLDENGLMEQAAEHLRWMMQAFRDDDIWCHVIKKGKSYVDAKLDDFAFLIYAVICMAQNSGESHWLKTAETLTEKVFKLFGSERMGYFYYSSVHQTDLPFRKIETYDGAQPSANAVMAANLLLLGNCCGRVEWLQHAEKMLTVIAPTVSTYGRSFAYWALVIQSLSAEPKQLIIVGEDSKILLKKWQKKYYPEVFTLISRGETTGISLLEGKDVKARPALYLCRRFECLMPMSTIENVEQALKKMT